MWKNPLSSLHWSLLCAAMGLADPELVFFRVLLSLRSCCSPSLSHVCFLCFAALAMIQQRVKTWHDPQWVWAHPCSAKPKHLLWGVRCLSGISEILHVASVKQVLDSSIIKNTWVTQVCVRLLWQSTGGVEAPKSPEPHMCVQAYPVPGCVSAHAMPWLGTMQAFEPHLIRSCLLAQWQCPGTSQPTGKLCQDQAALGEFSGCPQGFVPTWSGNPGTIQHPVPFLYELEW